MKEYDVSRLQRIGLGVTVFLRTLLFIFMMTPMLNKLLEWLAFMASESMEVHQIP
jgi:hypothetical protein